MRRGRGPRVRGSRTAASSPRRASGGSVLEDLLCEQLRLAGLPKPERQSALVPGRKFRADLYFPEARLAVEVHGGIYTQGRHSRGTGQESDYEKAALTALQGIWTLFVSGRHVRTGTALAWIEALLHRSGVNYGLRMHGGQGCE